MASARAWGDETRSTRGGRTIQVHDLDVVEVVHLSIYRPPSPRAPRSSSPHARALAIDAASFVKRDGKALVVERDFHGRIGAPTCGPRAGPNPATPEALELRQIRLRRGRGEALQRRPHARLQLEAPQPLPPRSEGGHEVVYLR